MSSCEQPFLWFRFLEYIYKYIYMIWDDSEENLLQLLDNLNKVHETIKFTYNYSIWCLYRTEEKNA